jgi:hypothetical protein
MDILKAASYGWDKRTTIKMFLRNLTPEEFRKHSWLDDYLSDQPSTMIYCMKTTQRITRDYEIGGDIGIVSGHGELRKGVELDTSPTFKESNGYREFVLKMAEHLGAEKKDISFSDPLIWDVISGNIWNGAEMIGHKEIADLAVYFHNEFVRKNKKGAKTRISAAYANLTLKEILRMKYNPTKVIEFSLEKIR